MLHVGVRIKAKAEESQLGVAFCTTKRLRVDIAKLQFSLGITGFDNTEHAHFMKPGDARGEIARFP
jgi:hypothetical protein